MPGSALVVQRQSMNLARHELVQLSPQRAVAPVRVLDLGTRQPGFVVPDKDLVPGLEGILALGVLPMDVHHPILQHIGVAIGPSCGNCSGRSTRRAVTSTRPSFWTIASAPVSTRLASSQISRPAPDHRQTAQRAGTANIAAGWGRGRVARRRSRRWRNVACRTRRSFPGLDVP